jgi:membrane protease YdiL (CAAX protease family)
VESVAGGAPGWLLLITVMPASVTEELLFRAHLIERLARITGKL